MFVKPISIVALVAVAGSVVACERNDGQNQSPNNNGSYAGQYTPNGQNGAAPNNGYNQYANNATPPNNGYGTPPQGTVPNNGAYPPSTVAPNNNAAPPAFPIQFPGMPNANPTPNANPSSPPPGTPAPSATNGFPFPFPGAPGSQPGSPSQSNAGQATPIDPTLASVATVPLLAYAAQQAQGMTKEGTILAGNFKEGQSLEGNVQLAPNKCYTVLAVGAGPQQVDIKLIATTPLPTATPVLAQSNTSGSNAALGGGGSCYKWPYPVSMSGKYVVVSTRGAGIIAAQLYSK